MKSYRNKPVEHSCSLFDFLLIRIRDDYTSRDYLNFLHAAWKHAGLNFYETWKFQGANMEF